MIAHPLSQSGHLSNSNIGGLGRRIQVKEMVLKPGQKNSIKLYPVPTTVDGCRTDPDKTIELIERVSPKVV